MREVSEPFSQCRGEVGKTLMSIADGADLLLTGMNFEDVATNVADYCDIPMATLQIFFADAGIDGERRYQLHGLAADICDLTLAQLYEVLKTEAGLPEETIRPYRQAIEDLSKAEVKDGMRPAVTL